MRGTICLSLLLLISVFSAIARADVMGLPSDGQEPSLGLPSSIADDAATSTHWQATYPLLMAPSLTLWLFRDSEASTLAPALFRDWEHGFAADDANAGLGGSTHLRANWPALRYSDADSNLSFTLSPGSPCMGACLKVAGSF